MRFGFWYTVGASEIRVRVVAQSGSVHRSGRWGRWFESSQPDFNQNFDSIQGLSRWLIAVLKIIRKI